MPRKLADQPANTLGLISFRDKYAQPNTTLMTVNMIIDVALVCEAIIIILTCICASSIYKNSLAILLLNPEQSFSVLLMDYTYIGGSAALIYSFISYRSKRLSAANVLGSSAPIVISAIKGWSITVILLITSLFAFKWSVDYPRGWVIAWFVTGSVGLIASRLMTVYIVAAMLGKGWLRRRRLAIVGARQKAENFARDLKDVEVSRLFDVVGIFDDRRENLSDFKFNKKINNNSDTIEDLVRHAEYFRPDVIVIALHYDEHLRIQQVRQDLHTLPADIMLTSDINIMDNGLIGVTSFGRIPLYVYERYPMQGWNVIFKWIQDKFAAIVLLTLLSPVLLVVAGMIKLESAGPIFFRQRRFGLNNKPINVFKFRSMYHNMSDLSGAQRTILGDARVTRVGWFIRRTSLDEVPQLINVLLGEMSLVGPRAHPIELKVMDHYYYDVVATYAARHRVKPGLTGLAQVNGLRGEVDTIDKALRRFELDLKYISEYSSWLDMRIIIMTFTAGLFSKHAY